MNIELDTIHNTDALTYLRTLPDESVHCCVTSPPYFGLRDYGTDGQIGLEPTPAEYVAALVTVFRELRRVLRSDGVVWLNIGDSYEDKRRIMIPARLAIALQDDGYWLRDEIVWHKPNPMPSPVDDRTTTAHEMIYLLTKCPRYWYDAEAIAEPASNTGGGDFMRALNRVQLQHGGESRTGRWARDKRQQQATRNRRSVWTISPEPFPAGHFAVMPPKLVELCILAGCPPDGVVIDPFMGAGTVALVARQLKRRWIGSEINAEYVRLANMRLQGRLDEYIAEQRGKPFMPYMFTEGAQP